MNRNILHTEELKDKLQEKKLILGLTDGKKVNAAHDGKYFLLYEPRV